MVNDAFFFFKINSYQNLRRNYIIHFLEHIINKSLISIKIKRLLKLKPDTNLYVKTKTCCNNQVFNHINAEDFLHSNYD